MLCIRVIADRVIDLFPVSVSVDILQAERIILRGCLHLGCLHGRPGIECVECQDAAGKQLVPQVPERGDLQLLVRQVHETAAGNDREGILPAGGKLRHIGRNDIQRETEFFRFGFGNFTHLFGKIRAVNLNAAFRQVQEHSACAAGHIHHAAGSVPAGQVQVKLPEVLMVIIMRVHHFEIPVIVFSNVLIIVQVHEVHSFSVFDGSRFRITKNHLSGEG